jgi:hypothetical protein
MKLILSNPKHSPFSSRRFLLFILAFALIGGYILVRSLAAPNPNLPGDLNADNTVNVTDLSILLSNYGTTNTNADINNDGSVNVLDLSILLSHYGGTYTPPAAASVDGLWYSPSSSWNTPIPVNPSIHPNSSAFINGFNTWCPNQGCFGAADYYSVPGIWKATDSTPLVTVEVNWPTTCRQSIIQVPIPAGAIPSASGDPEPTMAIMQSSTGEEWDFWKVTPPGVTPRNSSGPQNCPADSNWQAVAVFHFSPGWTGNGIGTSSRASGTLSGAGTIRPRDTKMPAGSTWEHALAIAYLGTTSVHVAPALSSDGQCTDSNACIPEGARLQLDPSLNCSTWPSLSAEWLRQECRTLQKYGAIVVDSGNGFIAENVVSAQGTNPAADGGGTGYQWPWNSGGATSLPADLVPHLRVLNW